MTIDIDEYHRLNPDKIDRIFHWIFIPISALILIAVLVGECLK